MELWEFKVSFDVPKRQVISLYFLFVVQSWGNNQDEYNGLLVFYKRSATCHLSLVPFLTRTLTAFSNDVHRL
jgi:hypothetical protein